MSKATEEALNSLHGALAKVLEEAITKDRSATLTDESGNDITVDYEVPAQILAQARQFLKDNSITTDIDTSTDLTSIQEKLKKKQKKGRAVLTLTNPIKAAHED